VSVRTKKPRSPLARLVSEAMAERSLSLRSFTDLAIDPDTGYRMSHTLANRIRTGRSFRPTPQLMRAIAAGTGRPMREVQAAAAVQFLGTEVPGEEPES
jgi:hypothetical protein